MANKFPRAFGDDCRDRAKQCFIKRAGDDDAQSAVGSYHPLPSSGVAKLARKRTQESHLSVAHPEARACQQVARFQWLARTKWVAHGFYSAGKRSAPDGGQNRPQQMAMLMRIDVGNGDTGRLNLANLGGGLGFDLGGI